MILSVVRVNSDYMSETSEWLCLVALGSCHPIADLILGENVARSMRLVAQFVPQAADERSKHINPSLVLWSPHLAQNLVVCQDASSMRRQLIEELVFGARKMNSIGGNRDATGREIDTQITKYEGGPSI